MATPSSCDPYLAAMIEESTDQVSLADIANITKSLKEIEDRETGLKPASPGKVILLTSDDKQFIASKATLARESVVFSDAFSLPNIANVHNDIIQPPLPIAIFVTRREVRSLYNAMRAVDCARKRKRGARDNGGPVVYFKGLGLEESGSLLTLADRFDCQRIQAGLTSVFECESGHLLKRCSDANVVPVAKIVIASLPDDDQSDWTFSRIGPYQNRISHWWETISPLRASWHLELTRLFWEGGSQLVDRPDEKRPRKGNGKAYPRVREEALHQTRKSWAQIAEEFNPPAW